MNSPLQGKDWDGRSMLRGYKGRMRPSAWARLPAAGRLKRRPYIYLKSEEAGESRRGHGCACLPQVGRVPTRAAEEKPRGAVEHFPDGRRGGRFRV